MKSKISSYIKKIKMFLSLPVFIYAENLILDGEIIVLDGAHTFETISLQNNSEIHVDSTTSKLILFCDSLYIDSTSGIYADNISLNQTSSGSDFTDVGAGGAGAGYASLGGNGGGDVESLGGIISGHLDSLSTGSIGGIGDVQLTAEDHAGGRGGGAVMIVSYVAEIYGKVSANGGPGNDYFTSGGTSVWDHGGSGGGSGGHIILNILHLEMHSGSLISVIGGDGGVPFEGDNEGEPVIPGGGGGGSGGYITISSLDGISSEFINVVGGIGGDNVGISCHPGQDGSAGSYHYKNLSIISSSHPDPTIYYLNNEPIFQLAATGQISGYFYEVTNNPNNTVSLAQSQAIPGAGEITIYEHGSLEDGTWYLHIIPYSSNGTFQENWAGTYQFRIGRNSVEVSSQTHPDSSQWYAGQTIVLDVSALPGISRYHYEFNRNPLTVPEIGISNQLSVSSWIEFASSDGEHFLHLIPEDSAGYVFEYPIRKRFNVGTQPPFNNFLQIASIDTITLSSSGPYDDIVLYWENTEYAEGDSFEYFIEFFLDFETIFSDTLISSNQDSAVYNGSEIYQGMLGVDGDTVLGYWWVHALADNDTLGSLNGPLPLVIMKEPYPLSPFYLQNPLDSATVNIDQSIINDTLQFHWTETTTENEIPIEYRLTFNDTSGFVNNDSSLFLFSDTVLSDNNLDISFLEIYNIMDSLGLDTVEMNWQVEAFDSIYSLESINGPNHLNLSILSPPLVLFNLEHPQNNHNLLLDMENILDTLYFGWTDSYNIFGDTSYFKILFQDTIGAVNNIEGVSLLSDTIMQNNDFSITHLDMFRKMDSLDIDTVTITWQVQVMDSSDSVFSTNGPFTLDIYRKPVNIDVPNITFEIQDSLLSRNTNLETQVIYIYDDTMAIYMDYSVDGGTSWFNEFTIDTAQNILNIGYNWDILDEFGWDYIDNVLLRLYAISDSSSSDTLLIPNINIANIVGDYIYSPVDEIGIKANDISELISVFYDVGEDIVNYDIGPSTGIAPGLNINPDGIIDFEDLATFTQMWYWSSEIFLNIDTVFSNYSIMDDNHFNIQPNIDHYHSNTNSYPFAIMHNGFPGVNGFELKIEYDFEDIEVTSISLGDNVLSNDNEAIQLDKHSKEKGLYMVSTWSKNQNYIPLNGILADLNVIRKNINKTVFPLQLYFLPYYSKYTKGSVMQYVLDIDINSLMPKKISLSANYPNPFNPSTKIEFSINKPGLVTVKIFDVMGREIQTLVNGYFQPGTNIISWNGKNHSGKRVGAGLYIYQLETYQTRISKKMVLMK